MFTEPSRYQIIINFGPAPAYANYKEARQQIRGYKITEKTEN